MTEMIISQIRSTTAYVRLVIYVWAMKTREKAYVVAKHGLEDNSAAYFRAGDFFRFF